MCRSRRMLNNKEFLAAMGVDTSEIWPSELWRRSNTYTHPRSWVPLCQRYSDAESGGARIAEPAAISERLEGRGDFIRLPACSLWEYHFRSMDACVWSWKRLHASWRLQMFLFKNAWNLKASSCSKICNVGDLCRWLFVVSHHNEPK